MWLLTLYYLFVIFFISSSTIFLFLFLFHLHSLTLLAARHILQFAPFNLISLQPTFYYYYNIPYRILSLNCKKHFKTKRMKWIERTNMIFEALSGVNKKIWKNSCSIFHIYTLYKAQRKSELSFSYSFLIVFP